VTSSIIFLLGQVKERKSYSGRGLDRVSLFYLFDGRWKRHKLGRSFLCLTVVWRIRPLSTPPIHPSIARRPPLQPNKNITHTESVH
jgi:hypothetical protein